MSKKEEAESLIFRAISNEKLDTVVYLIERGHSIHERNTHGQTILHCATAKGNYILVKLLLDLGSEVNTTDCNSKSCLHYASERVNVSLVQLLLDNGADLDSTDNNGRSCLHLAAENHRPDIIERLIQSGANINARDKEGASPLHSLFQCMHQFSIICLKLLLVNGAFANIKDHDGYTPLQYLIDIDSYSELLHTNTTTLDIEPTIRDIARTDNYFIECIELLKSYGAETNLSVCDRDPPFEDIERFSSPKIRSYLTSFFEEG